MVIAPKEPVSKPIMFVNPPSVVHCKCSGLAKRAVLLQTRSENFNSHENQLSQNHRDNEFTSRYGDDDD